MSFLPINEENKEAPIGQTTNAPGAGAAPPQTTGSAGDAPDASKGASAGSPTQFGSSASKLGAYLSANEPQITQQAANITGNLNKQYGDVSQGITNAANQFGQQVQAGYAAPNDELISRATQNPAEFAASPENVQAFQKQFNNAYTGPMSFESTSPYSDIQSQVGQAIQQGNLLGTDAGLQSYLQGQGNNPTRASATLDTLLLQGNPGAQASIRNAANQLGTLGDQFQAATTGANALVPAAQSQAEQIRQELQNRFTGEGGIIPSYQQELNDRLSNARKSATTGAQDEEATLKNIQQLFYTPNAVSDVTLGHLGITRDQWNQLARNAKLLSMPVAKMFGVGGPANQVHPVGAPKDKAGNSYLGINFDPREFFTAQNADVQINPSNYYSADDFAKAQALSQLTGRENFLQPSQTFGTAPTDIAAFNYQKALDKSNALYDNALTRIATEQNAGTGDVKNFKNSWDNFFKSQMGELNNPKGRSEIWW